MLKKTQVIVNPQSNHGRTKKKWKHIKEALKSYLKDYKCEFTEKPSQAIEISRSAIKEGSELIVGVGGDGTINEIANGFYENERLINPETELGIVPSGTGCDFIRSLNIPNNLKKALHIIKNGPSNLIDVGRVNFKNHSGDDCERLFLNIMDFGIGGEVVHRMNQKRMERKAASYFKCLISTFLSYKNKQLKITVDGKELPDKEYMIGAVSNGKIFGKGMKIAPEARLDDGFFDIVLIKGMKVLEFCLNAHKLYRGTHLSHPKISLIRGKKIKVTPAESQNTDVLIEVDGEQVGKIPLSLSLIPRGVQVKGNL